MPRRGLTITDRAIAKLLRDRTSVTDALLPGLELRRRIGGGGRWAYRYRAPGGEWRRVAIGTTFTHDVEAARAEGLALRRRVAAGEDPAMDARAASSRRRAAPTLADVVEQYVASGGSGRRGRSGPLAPRTAREYRRMARQLVAGDAELGAVPAARHRRADIRGLLLRVQERNGPVAANRLYQLVRAAARWAVAWEVLDVDPAAGVQRPAQEQAGTRSLADDEISALWEATSTAPLDAAVTVRLMLLLGQRPGETASMRLQDLVRDRDIAVWQIPAEHHKQRRGHPVPLPRVAQQQLELLGEARAWSGAWPRDDHRVLGVSLVSWRRWWEPIAKRAIEILEERRHRAGGRGPAPAPFTRHDLRRSVATGMVRIGIPPSTVSRVLGHSTATQARLGGVAQVTADVYVRDRQIADSLAALTAWSEHVAAIASGRPSRVIPFAL